MAALFFVFAARSADLAVVHTPGTPPPDPRPAPGPIGGSGNGRWQFATPTGIFVVDPATGEIAVQGATSGSPALVIVNLDKAAPPADTSVTLNGVPLVHAFGNPNGPFTVDPVGPQPIVGTGGFIELAVSSASAGTKRQLVLPCPSDVAMTSAPPIGSNLTGQPSVQLGFASGIFLNPSNPPIPALAGGPFPTATLLGYDPITGSIPFGPNGVALVGAGQLGVTVPISVQATTSQYLMDVRWPGFWQPDGETGAFCGLAKRWIYLNTACPAIAVSPATIPQGTVSSAYAGVTFASAGGAAPVSFALTGALPAGMTFDPTTATLGGTPAQTGTFPVTVTATDANGCTGIQGYTLVIAGPASCPPITVSPATIAQGTMSSAYTGATFTSAGAAEPVSFVLTGALPAGMTFDPATATLGGTPAQTGTFPLTVTARDANGCTGSQGYTLVIAGSPSCPTITIEPVTIPQGTATLAYVGVTFTSAGGAAPVSHALTGALPAGMSFNPVTATLGGTPTEAGTFPVIVTATDVNACTGSRGYTLSIADQPGVAVDRAEIVPVVLKLAGIGTIFSSELTLANTGGTAVDLTLMYTSEPSIVAGTVPSSGSVVQRVEARQQLVIGDVILFLKNRGVPVAAEDVGTLRVSYASTSAARTVFAQARTTSPSGIGRAGVGYGAPSTASLGGSKVAVYGLRQNASDRSNLALLNAGQAGPATFRVTVSSGDPGGAGNIALGDVTLQAGEWRQINGVLDQTGMTNGYATVERVLGTAPFVAYGVINDNGTSDGSFIEMSAGALPAEPLVVPVVVETPVFETELTLTNPGATDLVAALSYVESIPAGGVPATAVTVALPHGEQRTIPNVIDFLRTHGAGIGSTDTSHVGSVTVRFTAAGAPAAGWAGARVTTAAAGAGRYGVSYAGVPLSAAAVTEAFVTGLRQDGSTRSNFALVNAGDAGGPVTLTYEVFDGGTMQKAGQSTITLPPGGWFQRNQVLADFGVSTGYIRVVKVSGDDRFIAYGVVNDGGPITPGTNDGSVITMAGAR